MDADTLEVIKEAIQLEVEGRGFFTYAAEATENSLGKKMFERLAAEEIEHLKVFGELFTSLTGGDDWKPLLRESDKAPSAVIERLKGRVKNKEREKWSGDLEAMSLGMELERKAIDLFTRMEKESSSEEARKLAAEIIKQEQGHYDLLQAQYDSVNNAGFWLDDAEFRLESQY
jgi:rubrerythrin